MEQTSEQTSDELSEDSDLSEEKIVVSIHFELLITYYVKTFVSLRANALYFHLACTLTHKPQYSVY